MPHKNHGAQAETMEQSLGDQTILRLEVRQTELPPAASLVNDHGSSCQGPLMSIRIRVRCRRWIFQEESTSLYSS